MTTGIILAVLFSIVLIFLNGLIAQRRAKEEAERKLVAQKLKEALHAETLLNAQQFAPFTQGMQLLLCNAIERNCRDIEKIKKRHISVRQLKTATEICRQRLARQIIEIADEDMMLNHKIPISDDARKQFINTVRSMRAFIRDESKKPFADIAPLKREMELLNFLQFRTIIEIYFERARAAYLKANLAHTYELIEEVKKLLLHPVVSLHTSYVSKIENDVRELIEQIQQVTRAKERSSIERQRAIDMGDGLDRMLNTNEKKHWT